MKYKPDVVVRLPGCNVHVEMKYCLSCNPSVVGEDVEAFKVEALHNCPGHDLGGMQDIVQIIFRNGEKITAVFLRYYQRVAKVNRVDIKNRDDPGILIENLGWEFALNYFAKNTIHSLFSIQGEPVRSSERQFPSKWRISGSLGIGRIRKA